MKMSVPKEVEKLSYEQAYRELQDIVNLLDEGHQSLDEAIKLFERGQALARRCESLLNQAQLKVRLVMEEGEKDEGDA
jgi:exodeoxyribonuclease VII small subunit